MASDWQSVPVGNFFELVNGYAFKSRDFSTIGVPVIKIRNVKAGRFVKEALSFVARSFLTTRPDKLAQPNDLLISMSGNRHDGSPDTWVGKVAFFKETTPYLVNQRVGLLRLKPGAPVDPRFAAYQLSSWPYQQLFIAIATSSGGQANLSPHQILGATFKYPDLAAQRAIAGALGSLDDKIELNRRMNRTLEAMARALFKSWFVDFDPVHANAAGTPTLPPDLAVLFPSEFESSEIGDVPKGWNVGPILKHAELLSGGTPKTHEPAYWDGDILWASAKDVSQCGEAFLIKTERKITKKGLNESSTRLLPPLTTVVVARGATTGRLAMWGQSMAMNQTCYALRTKHDTPFSLYCHARQFIEVMVNAAHGSVFDTITTNTFRTTMVVLHPLELRQRFDQTVAPLFKKILANQIQSQTLAALRDSLLPKLLSGELSVGDASEVAV